MDFPHGHTTGKVGEPELSRSIVASAFALVANDEPEQLVDLDHRWADDDTWKDEVFLAVTDPSTGESKMVDDRSERHEAPQYQVDTDADAAAATHAEHECLVCAGIDY